MGQLNSGGRRFARIVLALLLCAIPASAALAQDGVEHIRDTGLDPELALEGNYVVRRNNGDAPFRVSLVRSAIELCGEEARPDHPRCSQLLIPGPGGWVTERRGWHLTAIPNASDLHVDGAAVSLVWDYARTSRLSADPAGSLAGTHGRPEDAVNERWERVEAGITRFGFAASEYESRHFSISPDRPTFTVSERGRVEARYDSWWDSDNDMRGNRPQVSLQLFGDNLWGLNYIEFEGPAAVQAGLRGGFEPAWPRFICRGADGEIFTHSYWTSCDGGAAVIGLQIALVAWPDIQPGEYTVRINGQPVVFDLVIHGWPGGSSAPDSLTFETPGGESLDSIGEGGAFRLVAHFETPPETDSVEAQVEGAQIGQAGWDGSIVPVTLSRSTEPDVYLSKSFFLTAPGDAQTARMRADSLRIEQEAIDRLFTGSWQVRHGPPLGSIGEVSAGEAGIDAGGGGLVLSLIDPSGSQTRWRAYDFEPSHFPEGPVVSGLTARFIEDRPEFGEPGPSVMPVAETLTARLNGASTSLRVSSDPVRPALSVRVTGRGAGTRMDGDWEQVSRDGQSRSGRAEWARGGTEIHSIWVTSDQGVPGYGDHPFAPGAERAALRTRRIVLIGRNLPPVADGAEIESLDDAIRYAAQSPIYAVSPEYPGDPAPRVAADREAILHHIQTLRGATPGTASPGPDLENLDFLVLTAELQPGVTPGMKSVRVNGSEPASWRLAFADQHLQPALSRDGEEDHVAEAYPGETLFAEARARVNSGYETVEVLLEHRRGEEVLAELPLTLRDLSVIRDDTLDESDGEERDPEPVYRSAPLFLADPAGEAVPEEDIELAATLDVELGDELHILSADPETFSLAPGRSITRIAPYPFDAQDYPLTDWEDALMQVARCLHRMPEHQARNFPEEARDDFAAFSNETVVAVRSTSYASSAIETFDHPGSAIWVYKQAYQAVNGRPFDLSDPPDTVTVTTGEWAAAILYGGAVARQMQATAAEMAELASDTRTMFALREAARQGQAGPLSAFWNNARVTIPLADRSQVPTEGPEAILAGTLGYGTLWLWDVYASDEAPLAATLDTAALAAMTGWSEPAAERWAVEQTQAALQQQVRATRAAIERARAAMDGCDYLELMKLARYRIDPIMETIYPRLVVRDRHEDGTWTMRTDTIAQMKLRDLPATAAAASAFEDFANADSAVFQLAVSAVFIPLGASYQAARAVQVGYDAYSLAGDVADIYQREQDYAYSTGLSVALGEQVVADAEARRAGAFDMAMLALGGAGLGSDLAELRRGMAGVRAGRAFTGTTGPRVLDSGDIDTAAASDWRFGPVAPSDGGSGARSGEIDPGAPVQLDVAETPAMPALDDAEFGRVPSAETTPPAVDHSTRRFDQSEVERLGGDLVTDETPTIRLPAREAGAAPSAADPDFPEDAPTVLLADGAPAGAPDAAQTPTLRTGEVDPDATLRGDAPTQILDAEDLTATRQLDAAQTPTMRTGEVDPDATLRGDSATRVLDTEDLTATQHLDAAQSPTVRTGEIDPDATVRTDAPTQVLDTEDLTATQHLPAAQSPTMRTGEVDPDATVRTDAPTQVLDAEDLTATQRLPAEEAPTARTGEIDPDATVRTDAPTQVLDTEDLTATQRLPAAEAPTVRTGEIDPDATLRGDSATRMLDTEDLTATQRLDGAQSPTVRTAADDPEFDRLPYGENPPPAVDNSTRRFDQSDVEQLGRPLMPDDWLDAENLTETRSLDVAESPTVRTGDIDPDATRALAPDTPTLLPAGDEPLRPGLYRARTVRVEGDSVRELGDEVVVRIGEPVGKGSSNRVMETTPGLLGDGQSAAVVRLARPGGRPAAVMEEVGARALEEAGVAAPRILATMDVLDEAGNVRRMQMVENVGESALERFVREGGRDMNVEESIAYDRATRALNERGYVLADTHAGNFSFRPRADGDGLEIVIFDTGGIVPVKGGDPSLAREIQRLISDPPPGSEVINVQTRLSRRMDDALDPDVLSQLDAANFNPDIGVYHRRLGTLFRVDDPEAAYRALREAEGGDR